MSVFTKSESNPYKSDLDKLLEEIVEESSDFGSDFKIIDDGKNKRRIYNSETAKEQFESATIALKNNYNTSITNYIDNDLSDDEKKSITLSLSAHEKAHSSALRSTMLYAQEHGNYELPQLFFAQENVEAIYKKTPLFYGSLAKLKELYETTFKDKLYSAMGSAKKGMMFAPVRLRDKAHKLAMDWLENIPNLQSTYGSLSPAGSFK